MKTSQNWLRDLLRIIIIFFKLLKKKKSERWLEIRTPDKKTVGRKRPLTSAGTDRRNRAEFEPASAAASAASSRSAHSARRTSPPSSASSCTWPCGKRGVRMTSHAAPQRRWRPADDRTIRFWRRRPPTPPGSNDPNKPTANRRRRRPIRGPLRSLRHLGGGGGGLFRLKATSDGWMTTDDGWYELTFKRRITESSDTPLADVGTPQLFHDPRPPDGTPLGAVVDLTSDPAGIEGVDTEKHRWAPGVAQLEVTGRCIGRTVWISRQSGSPAQVSRVAALAEWLPAVHRLELGPHVDFERPWRRWLAVSCGLLTICYWITGRCVNEADVDPGVADALRCVVTHPECDGSWSVEANSRSGVVAGHGHRCIRTAVIQVANPPLQRHLGLVSGRFSCGIRPAIRRKR